MGGLGSGRWRSLNRRQVVEACNYIAASDLRAFSDSDSTFFFPVRQHGGKIVGHLPSKFEQRSIDSVFMSYDLREYGAPFSGSLQIGTTSARSAGSRQCFLCPGNVTDGECRNLCRKLYLPPNEDWFGCRSCHALSYESQQRRAERLARVERTSAGVEQEFNEYTKCKNPSFDERLRMYRRVSYAIADLIDLLSNGTSSFVGGQAR